MENYKAELGQINGCQIGKDLVNRCFQPVVEQLEWRRRDATLCGKLFHIRWPINHWE